MKATINAKNMLEILYAKYGSMQVGKKECAEIVGESTQQLDRYRKTATGIPYSQTGVNNVKYNLTDIVDYLESNVVQTVA